MTPKNGVPGTTDTSWQPELPKQTNLTALGLGAEAKDMKYHIQDYREGQWQRKYWAQSQYPGQDHLLYLSEANQQCLSAVGFVL